MGLNLVKWGQTGLKGGAKQGKTRPNVVKYASSPEISAKMCQILVVWFGRLIFDTFLAISWDSVYIFAGAARRAGPDSMLMLILYLSVCVCI